MLSLTWAYRVQVATSCGHSPLSHPQERETEEGETSSKKCWSHDPKVWPSQRKLSGMNNKLGCTSLHPKILSLRLGLTGFEPGQSGQGTLSTTC
jgi:hypothetical protein